MKKLISCTLLALAVSGFAATTSFAGCTFGLLYNRCGCCGCGAKFCVRQYNAFSPVCSGTVFCNGCCPFGSGGGGPGPGYGGACGPCAGGMCPGGGGVPFSGVMSCPTGGCADGSCLGSLPAAEGMVPDATATPGANPVVTPSPLPTSPTSQAANNRSIQNAAYRPVSYPAPAPARPAMMQPRSMVAPSYWGN